MSPASRQWGRPILRRMRAEDLPALERLEAELFGGESWSRALLEAELAQAQAGDRTYLVLTDDERILGYAGLWFGDGRSKADLLTIATVPAARRRGLGGLMLDALVDAARDRGCTAVLLEVRASNAGAQALYRGRGFVELGRRRRYYQHPAEDALVMRLDLGARRPGPVGSELD